jgi:polysaccharide biosynthesis protein PelE
MYRLSMRWGASAEALAGLLLWLSASDWIAAWATNWIVLAAVLSHSVSSYFLARGFWQLLPRRYKLPARRSLSFLVAFIWILPVLGALGILWSITSALQRPRSRSSHNVKIVALPELPFSPPVIFPTPPYSQGALRQIVHFAGRPLKRLKAVMATRHMAPREAMAIWSKATCDPVDDVRLLAYAMRDSSEKNLTNHILALTEGLPDVPVRMRNACHKAIAALCWELVYHRLVQGAVKQHWLQTARRHMEVVLASPGDASLVGGSTVLDVADKAGASVMSDADSWLLYGRILLESGDLGLAGEAFANARAEGTDEQKILPWLAEIAFSERRFSEVKVRLSALTRPGERGHELALVRAWWNK